MFRGEGKITANDGRPPSAVKFESGTLIDLTAIPETGWLFQSWTGHATDTQKSIALEMNSDKKILAHFQERITTLVSEEIQFRGVGRWKIRNPVQTLSQNRTHVQLMNSYLNPMVVLLSLPHQQPIQGIIK